MFPFRSPSSVLKVAEMPAYTANEKTDMVCVLAACHGNKRDASRRYRELYPNRRHPDGKTMCRVNRNLRQYGKFRKPSRPSAEAQERRETKAVAVLACMYANPHDSTRHVANTLGMPQSTVTSILHRYKFHPYRIHLHQGLHADDHMGRVVFCMYMQEQVAADPTFLQRIVFSDEATFHRDGTVNRHNCHYWAQTNPFWLREDNHQVRWKTNVWCGIWNDRLIGPYFLPDYVTAETYLQLLQGPFTDDVLDDIPLQLLPNLWFQQDGHPAHRSRAVTRWLNVVFRDRWMGTGGPICWPPRSPDLTPLDFFLWGFLKSQVYETPPRDVEDLQDRIRRACMLVTPAMLLSVRVHLQDRFEQCVAANGGHFEQLL